MLLKKIFILAAIVVIVLSMTTSLSAEVIYVNAAATGSDPDGGSWEKAYTDLQDALEPGRVQGGDEIWVAKGVYKPTADPCDTGAEFDLVDGVAMYGGFVGGESDLQESDYKANKTYLSGAIGAGSRSSYVVLANGVSDTTVLDGFIITGGEKGIFCYQADAEIANCVVSDNSEEGIYCYINANPLINWCTVENNSLNGILVWSNSSATIINCKIRDNDGIGIYFNSAKDANVKNNWIHHNGSYGIAFSGTNGMVVVRNNTVVYNSDYGIRKWNPGTEPAISNCILWGNAGELNNCDATYSCIEVPPDPCNVGVGNILSNPNFAYDDPSLWNFHLDPVESPCVDAGDPCGIYDGQSDIDDGDRVIGSRVDMGADEAACSDVYNEADFNADGFVGFSELLEIINAWLSEEGEPNYDAKYDLKADGKINMADFAGVADVWLWEACWK